MDTTLYLRLVDLLMAAAFLVGLRHLAIRFRFHLHRAQLLGYKGSEIAAWHRQHLLSKVFTPEHLFFGMMLTALLMLLSPGLTHTSVGILFSSFVFFWFGSVRRYQGEPAKKPLVMTPRARRLAVTAALLTGLLLLAGSALAIFRRLPFTALELRFTGGPRLFADPYLLFFSLLIADLTVPLIMRVSNALMYPVETRIQNGFKRRAQARIRSAPDLRVVAITGSYGKTSTKFMLSTLLEERFAVCTTPGSYNTPMGICKVVNDDLRADHRFILLEMGARSAGNIDELCDIATPDISIVTSVGPAHLETFGTLDTIAWEKGTLARRLRSGGLLVLNGDDPLVAGMGRGRDDIRILRVHQHPADGSPLRPEPPMGAAHDDVYDIAPPAATARDIRVTPEGCRFTLSLRDPSTGESSSVEIRIALLGRHNIQNFLLAAAAAHALGLRPDTIASAARRIAPVEHRLELKQRDGLIILDDAFNSNPVGAANAVEVLRSMQGGRKILITPGMVELGSEQEALNTDFGRTIGRAGLDHILLVGPRQTEPIRRGILEVDADAPVTTVRSLFEANDWLARHASPGDVVLYENDLPDTYNE